MPHLEITEVILANCNIVNHNYQEDSRVFCTFVSNKWFGQLLDISPNNFIYLKIFNSQFLYIEVWFTNQSSRHLEDKISITLGVNWMVKYK